MDEHSDNATISPTLTLQLLRSYRDRPGHKNSWPTVIKAIEAFAVRNHQNMPPEIWLATNLLSRHKLSNFDTRQTPLEPRVLRLIHLFLRSDEFFSEIPWAKQLIGGKRVIEDEGKTLTRIFGNGDVDIKRLDEYADGFWLSQLRTDPNNSALAIRDIIYIEHIDNKPFAIFHYFLQKFNNHYSSDGVSDQPYEYIGKPYNLLKSKIKGEIAEIVSGYLFFQSEDDSEQEIEEKYLQSHDGNLEFRALALSRISGKQLFSSMSSIWISHFKPPFWADFSQVELIEESGRYNFLVNFRMMNIVKKGIVNLRKFEEDSESQEIINWLDKYKWSVINDE